MMRNLRSDKFQDLLLWISLILILPFSFNCIDKPLEPKAPEWDTQLTIPLLEKTYYFGDIVNKDSKFDTSTGVILYKPAANDIGFRQGMPADIFNMPSPKGNTIDQQIGLIPIASPSIPPILIQPSDLGINTLPTTIPPLTPDPPPTNINNAFGDSSLYKYLVFENGQITLSIKNNFPFSIQIVGNNVQLVNKIEGSTLANFSFPNNGVIAAGATASSQQPLANQKLEAELNFIAQIQIVNWAGTTITSASNLTATLSISNSSTIKSALAKTINFDYTLVSVPDSSVLLDDSIKVKFAKFKSGKMLITLANHIGLDLTAKLRIDELLVRATGKKFVLTGANDSGIVTIPAHATLVDTIDMAKTDFVSRNRSISNDTLVTQHLHFNLELKTISNNAGYSLINSTDNVVADVQPSTAFVLDEVEGKVPPKQIDINEPVDAGIGDISNKLSMTAFNSGISLSTKVLSTGLFPTNLVLKVYAIDSKGNRGQSILVGSPSDISQGYHRILPGVEDVIPISPADVNLLMNSFLSTSNELPSKFLLEGYALVSPLSVYNDNNPSSLDYTGGVKQTDSILVSLDYSIPVEIGIQDGSLKDTSSFTGSGIDTAQINLIKSGKIFFDIENTFPLHIELRMKLLKADMNDKTKPDTLAPAVLSLPQDVSNPSTYPPISIESDTTVARTGVKSFTFLNLSSEDAAKISEASFTAVDLGFYTGQNHGTVKTFYKSDKIKIKTFANIIFNVNFDRLNNK